MPKETSDAIRTHRLTKHYGSQRVVDSLNLRVQRGQVYGFLGRNGAGKSTTIKMLMGMVQPDSGTAELLGEPVAEITPETRARIAYIAEGHPLYNWMTIGEAVRFTRAFYPLWNDTLVEQILDHFELPTKRKLRRLSCGQRAQVSLALAVAPEPELLILDDPTLGLDTVVRRDFLESLIQIIHREGRTILFSSHILGDVERVADRIGILVDGVLRVDCPTDQFRESVKKLVLDFTGPAPEGFACPGLVQSWNLGNQLELVLVGYDDLQRSAIEALGPRNIEVVDLNLEEAFIEYTRGRRRSLPLFGQEKRDAQSTSDQGAA
ncbi:ABC transporter ATP-binding protein [Bythopirellula goksoeyrii]|uniref:ABC transporter ATP-binding protein YtrB n=1 Tax=Bythopirellula goksoeyrii TaxID=1400387 RepID=A0A5B9QDP7_9BACT|nr:ABC transporter ATP-binding protein [Bythopirellula goksoeyrii]QEG35066.1 ABC transporter ATP-binding protein YtrB [Bythopirellula goksoeyrii]